MTAIGTVLVVTLLWAPPSTGAPTAPRSNADFDALHARLGAADPKIRQAASNEIARADDTHRKAYLARLKQPKHRLHTANQRVELTRAGLKLHSPSGWFNIPKLKMGEKTPDHVDMLAAALAHKPPTDNKRRQAYVMVLETVSILRALAGMRDLKVAETLVRFAFEPYGITFRWEVVRAIRGLGGYGVPALLKLSRLRVRDWRKQRTRYLIRRFSFYILTTLEEANAQQALALADKPLKLLLLGAYGKYRDAEAAAAVIRLTDHVDPDVRRAARDAITAYFKGPRPRARVRRLKLPGGQETERLQKLYLSFRERAIVETRRELERLTSGRYDRSIPGKQLVRMLFDKQDERRATRWKRRLKEALALYAQGDLKGALAVGDEILRSAPTFADRTKLFPLLVTRANQLTLEGRLARAASLFERAALLIGDGERGEQGRRRRIALADATYLRALEHEAHGRGERAGELHRQALAFWPDHLGSRVALMHLAPAPRTDPALLWFLVLLAALGAPGLLLLGRGLWRLRD